MILQRRTIGAVGAALVVLVTIQPGRAQTDAANPAAIKPFKAHIPDSVLADLRRRLGEAKWPDQLPGTTWEYGADISKVRELANYWQKDYDWRAQEAKSIDSISSPPRSTGRRSTSSMNDRQERMQSP